MFDENIRIQLLVKYTCYSNPYAGVTNTVKLWSFYVSIKCFVVHCLHMPCVACGILWRLHDVLGSLISCGFVKVAWIVCSFVPIGTHAHTHTRTHTHTCAHTHTHAHAHTTQTQHPLFHTHTHTPAQLLQDSYIIIRLSACTCCWSVKISLMMVCIDQQVINVTYV
jgi:hypothetical protein